LITRHHGLDEGRRIDGKFHDGQEQFPFLAEEVGDQRRINVGLFGDRANRGAVVPQFGELFAGDILDQLTGGRGSGPSLGIPRVKNSTRAEL
jgi:hypothetical protein